MSNDFYHLPHQLLASGLERFMKSYICLVHRAVHGQYTSKIRHFGHDLSKLLTEILHNYYGGRASPPIQSDYEFLSSDSVLHRILRILSNFGKLGRYHNLDIITGNHTDRIDPTADWKELEISLLDPIAYAGNWELMRRDYYSKVNSKIIASLERMLRALALQFTLGQHKDSDNHLGCHWGLVSSFGTLQEFGTTDYRPTIQSQRKSSDVWENRSNAQIEASRFPTQTVCRTQFAQEWPFKHDRVVVECRNGIFAIIYIEGFAFSLNGAARSRFRYPDPHEAGLAVLGKSVGPFIDIAFRRRTVGKPS